MKEKLKIFDIEIDNLSMDETISEIIKAIEEDKKIVHVGVNSNKIVLMDKDPYLKEVIQEADIINADGYSMVMACRWLLKENIERVTGIDTMYHLLKKAEEKEISVYFLGTTEEILQKLLKVVKMDYPNLNIVGYHNGFFRDHEEEVIRDIQQAKPQMLFIGITSPYKEIFVHKYKDQLNANLLMGVGGSFDVLSGEISRAPLWMQNHGLEWLHRFMKEPKRLFKRYVIENIKFMYLLWQEKRKK